MHKSIYIRHKKQGLATDKYILFLLTLFFYNNETADYAGLSIPMNNAEEEVKSIAGHVTQFKDRSGVAYGIYGYILANIE